MKEEIDGLMEFTQPNHMQKDKAFDMKQHLRPKPGERLCFVITKNKQNSWADDLYACELIRKGDHVYN